MDYVAFHSFYDKKRLIATSYKKIHKLIVTRTYIYLSGNLDRFVLRMTNGMLVKEVDIANVVEGLIGQQPTPKRVLRIFIE